MAWSTWHLDDEKKVEIDDLSDEDENNDDKMDNLS